jgi:hypothetical protein
VTETPYTKLALDVSIRKYVFQLPRYKQLFKLYAGGGFDLTLSTPVISANMLKEALGEFLTKQTYYISDPTDMKAISSDGAIKSLMNNVTQGLTQKTGGLHLLAGMCFQIPVVPLALYVDAKCMLPFQQLDQFVSLGGFGFVVSAGIAFSVPNPVEREEGGSHESLRPEDFH